MRGFYKIFFIVLLLLINSCRHHGGYPRNKYLEMKERPSEKLKNEDKKAKEKTNKQWKKQLKMNKRDSNR
jgi:hypothetical protein